MEAGSPTGQKNVFVKHADGSTEQLAFDKEQSKVAVPILTGYQKKYAAQVKLADAFEKMSTSDWALNKSNTMRAAESQDIDPLVKAMGGRLNSATIDALKTYAE